MPTAVPLSEPRQDAGLLVLAHVQGAHRDFLLDELFDGGQLGLGLVGLGLGLVGLGLRGRLGGLVVGRAGTERLNGLDRLGLGGLVVHATLGADLANIDVELFEDFLEGTQRLARGLVGRVELALQVRTGGCRSGCGVLLVAGGRTDAGVGARGDRQQLRQVPGGAVAALLGRVDESRQHGGGELGVDLVGDGLAANRCDHGASLAGGLVEGLGAGFGDVADGLVKGESVVAHDGLIFFL